MNRISEKHRPARQIFNPRKDRRVKTSDPNAAAPIIGRYYRVPCLLTHKFGISEWLPVIGPPHEDRDIIGFKWHHWHFDWRFFPSRIFNASLKKCFRENPSLLLGNVQTIDFQEETKSTLLMLRRCQREMPEFSIEDWGNNTAKPPRAEAIPFIAPLERAYSSAVLKSCKICPHRGMPLGGMPVKDGKITCPGHGLCFDATTGKLVRRLTFADQAHRAHEGRVQG